MKNSPSASHGGHSMHGMPAGDTRALVITGWLTGLYFVIELAIGIWSGSIAVISDAFHTFSAVGGVLIALVAAHFARRPASRYATFGLIRAEIIGALLNGLFLLLMAIYVFWMGYMRLKNPVQVLTGPMLLAAAGGLVTETISLALMIKRSKNNLNMQGALWHVVQTFVGSLLIIVAAVVIRYTGFYAIDPILGMLFGLVLLWASWGIIRDSVRILLQIVPDDLDLNALVDEVARLDFVRNVHHPHAWALTSGKNIVSMHVLIDKQTDCADALRKVYHRIKEKFPVYFATVQIETECPKELAASEIDAMASSAGETPHPESGSTH
jgi:cobalt-zinc-cadmium efflux system protein